MAGSKLDIKRYLPLIGIGGGVFVVCAGLAYLIINAMNTTVPPAKKTVTQITIIKPPPPPPEVEKMPEPEVQEEVDVPEPEEAMPEPDLADIPDGPLGLDADGTAGLDGFGLAARRGGMDITAGGDPYGWYKNTLKNDVLAGVADMGSIRRDAYEIRLKLWIDRTGRVERYQLMGTTGDSELDRDIERALASIERVSEAPPPGTNNPWKLRFRVTI